MKIVRMVFCIAIAAVAAEAKNPPRLDWGFHRSLLKERFDTTYRHEFYPDEMWSIKCVFFDFDGDGTEEMLARTTSGEDRMGDYWRLWKIRSGKFEQCKFSGDITFACFDSSFFAVSHSDGGLSAIGLDMDAGYGEGETGAKTRTRRRTVFSASRRTADSFLRR
ncbi:MAG: hypothetical protein IJ678_00375 [Kiritimatiellae bacterium]|nr:hypothetical protein [Kiritimatiellia bacterium]